MVGVITVVIILFAGISSASDRVTIDDRVGFSGSGQVSISTGPGNWLARAKSKATQSLEQDMIAWYFGKSGRKPTGKEKLKNFSYTQSLKWIEGGDRKVSCLLVIGEQEALKYIKENLAE